MKYRKTILASAIGTALSLNVGSVFAAVQFERVDSITASEYTTAGEWAGFAISSSANVPTTYAAEMFGAENADALVLPGCVPGTSDYAAVEYTVSVNELPATTDITFTLTGAEFQTALLGIYDNEANGPGSAGGPWQGIEGTPLTGTTSGNEVTFRITPDGGPVDGDSSYEIGAGSKFALLYKLNSASSLAEAGNEIQMAVSVSKDFGDEITIADSKEAFDITITATDVTSTKISVAEQSTQFTGDGTDLAWVGSTEAMIGTIEIANASEVSSCNGDTIVFGEGPATVAGTSILQITDGQFSASAFDNSVTLQDVAGGIIGGNTTEDIDAITGTATIYLGSSLTEGTHEVHLFVDGENSINVPENNPLTALSIDFEPLVSGGVSWGLGSIFIEGEVARIRKDGTVCHVLNVPNTGAQDKFNLRLTNSSGLAGDMSATLYGMDGSILASGPLHPVGADSETWELQPSQTIRLSAEDLETIFGISAWSGRAMMEINSTIKDLEALVLLRHVDPGSPLTNLSQGAQGVACESN